MTNEGRVERRRNGLVIYALVAAIIALAVSLFAYAGRGRPAAVPPPRPPAMIKLSMVVATFSGVGVAAHRWYPTMLVVRQGDTVDLAVGNPDKVNHEFGIPNLNVKTKKLTPGLTEQLSFVADRAGVYTYQCMLPYDPSKGNCTPDHELMRGYLIVTE